ncbi:hypothetical protein BJX64DRAFT_287951 [Aspergillus heterothallicus]
MEANLPDAQKPKSTVPRNVYHLAGHVSHWFSKVPLVPRKITIARSPLSRSTSSATNTAVSSSQSSVCAPVTTNNTTVASPPATSIADQSSHIDRFRDSLPLPELRGPPIYVYPHTDSLISEDHHARYHVLVNIFKQKVERERTLRPHVKDISYTMRLCGRSPKESHPSIIIICADKVFRDLQRLFNSSDLKTYYAILDPNWIRDRASNKDQDMADIDIPRFHVYYWVGRPPKTLLGRPEIASNIQIKHIRDHKTSTPRWLDLTMCGSQVITSDGSGSTLACLLEIDSQIYGLTVAHVFPHLIPLVCEENQTEQNICDSSGSADLASEVVFEDDAFVKDDIQYDIPDGDTTADHDPLPDVTLEVDKIDGVLQLGKQERSSPILIMEPASPNTPDLDWALIKVSDEESKKPNFYLAPDDAQKPILLHTIAQHHPGHERPVFVIRTLQDPRPGTLLRGSSFIGGITRAGQCEVWNITFAGPHGLVKGDSGSLVVDRETSEIYGFIIGMNPFGEAYVMPMAATLAQIKKSLDVDRVSLPNPYSLTKSPSLALTSSPSLGYLEQALDNCEATISDIEAAPSAVELNYDNASSSPSLYLPSSALNTALTRVSSYPSVTESITSRSFTHHYQPPPEFSLSPSHLMRQETMLVFAELNPNKWQACDWDLDSIMGERNTNVVVFALRNFEFRHYRHYFNEMLETAVSKDINGHFHCEFTVADTGTITPRVSWSCFKIKRLRSVSDYSWDQPCIHVDWDCKTGRQVVFVFDFLRHKTDLNAQSFLARVCDFEERMLNPFVWHRVFARDIYDRYSHAIWSLRDIVREQEKRQRDLEDKETPFAALHDLSRHCYDYKEVVEVAEHTLDALVAQHTTWRQEDPERFKSRKALAALLKTQQGFLLEARRAHSLKIASTTLSDRSAAQINLAFNMVAQESGQAASATTTMMKSVTFISAVYLPGIYVSGVFGTKFFYFQSNDASTVSSDFWIFWAATIPLTLLTLLVWWAWHHAYFERVIGETHLANATAARSSLPISIAKGHSPVRDTEPFAWMSPTNYGENDAQPALPNLVRYFRRKAKVVHQWVADR